jgi:hypothetical protein
MLEPIKFISVRKRINVQAGLREIKRHYPIIAA